MEFKYRLRDLRRERNISGKTLAQCLGVTDANVSQWENGRNYPNQSVLEKIADYFDVSLDYLMGRTDIKKPIIDITQIPYGYDKLTKQQKEVIDDLIAILVAKNEKV